MSDSVSVATSVTVALRHECLSCGQSMLYAYTGQPRDVWPRWMLCGNLNCPQWLEKLDLPASGEPRNER